MILKKKKAVVACKQNAHMVVILLEIDVGRGSCQVRLQGKGKTPHSCHGQNIRRINETAELLDLLTWTDTIYSIGMSCV